MLSPNRPFAPARFPFFYGWFIVLWSTVGVLMSLPGQTMGVSVFSDPLIEATGLTRVGLANTYLVGTVASGLLLPLGGRLLDRHGARQVAMGASVLLGLSLVLLSRVDHLARALSPAPWVMAGTLALAFSVLRFSGQGMLTLASRNMVPMWFDRRRGLASGLYGVCANLGFSYAPVAFAAWIAAAGGWREAWTGMALACGVGMTFCAWAFYRDSPEECGLRMDGAPAEPEPDAARADGSSPGEGLSSETRRFTLAEALRTGSFWAVTLTVSIHSALVTGVTFHIVDLGSLAGLDQEQAVALFPPMAILSILTGFLTGAATDRYRLRGVVFLMLAGEALGYASLTRLDEDVFRYAGILGLGLSSGCFGSLTTVASAKLFGRLHLGSISSAQMSSLVLSSALGPSLLAFARERFDSYGPALLAGAALPALVAVLTLLTRDPVRGERVW